MKENEELKPCPFCGNQMRIFDQHMHCSNLRSAYDACCDTEGCFLEDGAGWYIGDREQLVKMINTRK